MSKVSSVKLLGIGRIPPVETMRCRISMDSPTRGSGSLSPTKSGSPVKSSRFPQSPIKRVFPLKSPEKVVPDCESPDCESPTEIIVVSEAPVIERTSVVEIVPFSIEEVELTERLEDIDAPGNAFKHAEQKEVNEKKRLRDLPSIIRSEKARLKELYEAREKTTGQWSPASKAILAQTLPQEKVPSVDASNDIAECHDEEGGREKSPIRTAQEYYRESPRELEEPETPVAETPRRIDCDGSSDVPTSEASTRNPLDELDLRLNSVDHFAAAKAEAANIFERTLKRVKERCKEVPGHVGDGAMWDMNRLFSKGKLRLYDSSALSSASTTAQGSTTQSHTASSSEEDSKTGPPSRNVGIWSNWNRPVEYWDECKAPYNVSTVRKLENEKTKLETRYPGQGTLYKDYVGMDALRARAKDEANALIEKSRQITEARLKELETL